MFNVKYITNHIYNSRTYILSEDSSDSIWLVDCGDVDKVLDIIGSKEISGVLLTHSHSDHIYGLNELLRHFPDCQIFTNEYGKNALLNSKLNLSHYHTEYDDFVLDKPENIRILKEGDEVIGMKVLFTPGHDPSCLCYLAKEMCFTGDSYIPSLKVVTTFPHSNKQQALESLKRIEDLGKDITIFPGHTINE